MNASSPVDRLREGFERIQRERMQDVAWCRADFTVEPVGFVLRDGDWTGVLVLPWAVCLLRLPGPQATWPALEEGEAVQVHYPSGAYRMYAGAEAGIGVYLSGALAGDVRGFTDQQQVRAMAQAVLDRLWQATASAAAPAGRLSVARRPSAIDRRGFLTARWAGKSADPV